MAGMRKEAEEEEEGVAATRRKREHPSCDLQLRSQNVVREAWMDH